MASPRRRAFRRKSDLPRLYTNVLTLQVPSGELIDETDENDNKPRRASFDGRLMSEYINSYNYSSVKLK